MVTDDFCLYSIALRFVLFWSKHSVKICDGRGNINRFASTSLQCTKRHRRERPSSPRRPVCTRTKIYQDWFIDCREYFFSFCTFYIQLFYLYIFIIIFLFRIIFLVYIYNLFFFVFSIDEERRKMIITIAFFFLRTRKPLAKYCSVTQLLTLTSSIELRKRHFSGQY